MPERLPGVVGELPRSTFSAAGPFATIFRLLEEGHRVRAGQVVENVGAFRRGRGGAAQPFAPLVEGDGAQPGPEALAGVVLEVGQLANEDDEHVLHQVGRVRALQADRAPSGKGAARRGGRTDPTPPRQWAAVGVPADWNGSSSWAPPRRIGVVMGKIVVKQRGPVRAGGGFTLEAATRIGPVWAPQIQERHGSKGRAAIRDERRRNGICVPGAGRNIPGGGRVMPQLIDYRIGRLQPARPAGVNRAS